jgi:hypothetical protein
MFINPYPKIAAPTAAGIAKGFTPSPPAAALLKPNMAPAQYLTALEQNNLSNDAIKTLAHGMPERESVWYACQSSQRVAGQLPPNDATALNAAEAWVKNPNPATQANAAAAAAATDYQGPGAWAAQGAAWSTTTPGAPPLPAVPGMNPASLTPHATASSVQLASAMEAGAPMPKIDMPALQQPVPPELPAVPALPQAPALAGPTAPALPQMSPPELQKTAQVQQPYVALGKDIAAGNNTWS